jgi:hypothetical protein
MKKISPISNKEELSLSARRYRGGKDLINKTTSLTNETLRK